MAWLKWEQGRQGGGYRKLKLFQFLGRMDGYVIDYPVGFSLPTHKDPTPHGRHYRLNIILSGEGDFYSERSIINTKRIKLFRPDINNHGVKTITKRRRVLSFGLVI
jgi:hypothetical protein